jgi:hypothetical protein
MTNADYTVVTDNDTPRAGTRLTTPSERDTLLRLVLAAERCAAALETLASDVRPKETGAEPKRAVPDDHRCRRSDLHKVIGNVPVYVCAVCEQRWDEDELADFPSEAPETQSKLIMSRVLESAASFDIPAPSVPEQLDEALRLKVDETVRSQQRLTALCRCLGDELGVKVAALADDATDAAAAEAVKAHGTNLLTAPVFAKECRKLGTKRGVAPTGALLRRIALEVVEPELLRRETQAPLSAASVEGDEWAS